MKMDPHIERALSETGLPWTLETAKGHLKLRLNGRLVGVMSHSSKTADRVASRNVVSQIRRAAKEMQR